MIRTRAGSMPSEAEVALDRRWRAARPAPDCTRSCRAGRCGPRWSRSPPGTAAARPPAARPSGARCRRAPSCRRPKNTRSPTLTSRSGCVPGPVPCAAPAPPAPSSLPAAEAGRVGGADAGGAGAGGRAGAVGQGLVGAAAGREQQEGGGDGDEASNHGLLFPHGGARRRRPAPGARPAAGWGKAIGGHRVDVIRSGQRRRPVRVGRVRGCRHLALVVPADVDGEQASAAAGSGG